MRLGEKSVNSGYFSQIKISVIFSCANSSANLLRWFCNLFVPFLLAMKSIPIAKARKGKNTTTPMQAISSICIIRSMFSLFSNIGLLRPCINNVKHEKYTGQRISPQGGPA